MARATSPSDSEPSPTKSKKDVVVESEEEGDPVEYEIEEILDAKRGGVFPDGELGYFVKWKGYDSSENSWQRAGDMEGAEELVKEFWTKHPRKHDMLFPSAKKKARRSTAGGAVSEAGKKRGRKPARDEPESEEEDEAPPPSRATKKAKTNGKKGVSASTGGRSVSPEIDAQTSDMTEYMHLETWEHIVKSVDTVEKDEETGGLVVYFTVAAGSQARETSALCKQKFPQKLLEFYESNLQWRTAKVDEY